VLVDVVTMPAKINHMGTLIYLRNTNLKYSMCLTVATKDLHKKHSKAITTKLSYKYLLFRFPGFAVSFSDVAQHNGINCVPKELSMVPKPH